MLPEFITNSTLPQWISAVASTGILVSVLRFVIQWRGQSITADGVLRDHYAAELARLTEKLDEKATGMQALEKHLREMVDLADERWQACQDERDHDRQRIAEMQLEIDGLKRQLPIMSADRLLILEDRGRPSEVAPSSLAAAKKMKGQTK